MNEDNRPYFTVERCRHYAPGEPFNNMDYVSMGTQDEEHARAMFRRIASTYDMTRYDVELSVGGTVIERVGPPRDDYYRRNWNASCRAWRKQRTNVA